MIKVNGFNNTYITLHKSGEIENGTPVVISDNLTVAPATDATFCGVCVSTDDEFALVQMTGYVEVKCASNIELGEVNLVTDGNGLVCVGTGGIPCAVVSIDSENGRCGIIL